MIRCGQKAKASRPNFNNEAKNVEYKGRLRDVFKKADLNRFRSTTSTHQAKYLQDQIHSASAIVYINKKKLLVKGKGK